MTTENARHRAANRIISPHQPITMTITLDPGTGQANMVISQPVPVLTVLDLLNNLFQGYWKQHLESLAKQSPTGNGTENQTEKPTGVTLGVSGAEGGANGKA